MKTLQPKLQLYGGNLVGNSEHYSTYTSEIIDAMYKDGEKHDYILKKGDNVIITIKNTNETLAKKLRDVFFQITGEDDIEIVASASGMVINNGSKSN